MSCPNIKINLCFNLIILMSFSNEIRESLMQIKQTQAELLRDLKNEHTHLQGYLSSSDNNSYNYTPNKQIWRKQYSTPSYENSLELSKSQGNLPNYRNFQYKASSTTGAEDILENNYKKIEELLIKQRKLYQQNHALQEENESLGDDYRQIKKMYYELKQSNKDNLIILDFLLNQIVFNSFRDLLLELPNSEITAKTTKSWNKFKIEHPKLFLPTSSCQQFCSSSEKYLQKIYSLLEQDFKLNTIKTKEQQILQLKEKITYLININTETNKNKSELLETEQKRILNVERQNSKLLDTVRKLEKELADKQRDGISRIKNLQADIIVKQKQVNRLTLQIQEKADEIENYRDKSNKLKSQQQTTSKNVEQISRQLKSCKEKLKQKQSLFQNQIQLSRRQNSLIEKLTQDLSICQSQLQNLPQKSTQTNAQLLATNQSISRELQALKQQYTRYRQNTQRQIASLITHSKQIKNQHQMLIKSQQNARLNQMRYREIVAAKGNVAKLTSTVDHLWAVKEIEYGNIMEVIGSMRNKL